MPYFQPRAVTTAVALLALAAAAQAQAPVQLDQITVQGDGDKLGTGLLMNEDAAKAKSNVSRAQLEKMRSSSNPYQALTMLPGVNATSYDATGMFGGNLRVRGFNSDQMGFTINGAPVNDSGSFSVFPQEYSDAENLCELFVTQGATDNEAPHVGASGGNVGLITCRPENTRRLRLAGSAGQLKYHRAFVRFDTGKIGDFKSFVSYSNSAVDKWKGAGGASREHVDAAAEYDLGKGSKLSASLLYNNAFTNNYRSLTQAQLASGGYYADFAVTPPQHLTPVAGTAQNEASIASGTAYYGYALNPFKNYLATAKGNFQLTNNIRLDVEPYFWYGYGTGGVQQTSIAESAVAGSRLHTGIADINGDGDLLDTVMVYRGSLTETFRPGVTTKLNWWFDNHRVLAGIWYERARHRQTQPAVRVDNAGNIDDPWLGSDQIKFNDGTLYQGRNWLTISTGKSYFIQDTIELMGGKLTVTPGLSHRSVRRDFTNFANAGTNAGADYSLVRTFPEWLPSIGLSYNFDDRTQGYLNVTKNFKVPGNFSFQSLASGVTFTNGVGKAAGMIPASVQAETAVNLDVGARYRSDLFRASATAFLVKFKNRIASSFDPFIGITHDWNVGDSTTKGLELEAGTVPWKGFSAYGSFTYTKSTIDANMLQSATATYATAGKQFPDTPKLMSSLSLQYAAGPFLANLQAKYTSSRWLTLVNDLAIGGYTLWDLNLAYKLPSHAPSGFKDPIIRVNVSNLTNKKYFLANSGSGSTIAINSAGNPNVYAGAPRFSSITFQVDY